MINNSEAFLFLLEVDKELADDLGEDSLASEIAAATAETSRTQSSLKALSSGFRFPTLDIWEAVGHSADAFHQSRGIDGQYFTPFREGDHAVEVEIVDADIVDDAPESFEIRGFSYPDDVSRT